MTRDEMDTEPRTEKLTISVVAAMMDGEPLLRLLSQGRHGCTTARSNAI